MKEEAFKKLVNSVRQAGKIRRKQLRPSRVIEYQAADIKAIRSGLKKSQAEFAMMIGVSKDTLQNWEQGRRRPVGPARALLKIAEENPKAVVEALG
jgi:putative transcriptional regulator